MPNILIVDDEPDIAEELADLIASEGYDVSFTTRATDALQKAVEHHFELVISDMRMPDMDGAELIRKIADQSGRPQQFIIISGHLEARDDLANLHDVDYSLITKPIDVDALLQQIGEIAGQPD